MSELRPRTVVILAATLSACGGTDAEQEIRALLAGAEAAAESRSTGYFRGLISDDYVDARGSSKDELIDRIRGFFLVNPTVEVTNRVDAILFDGDGVATVRLSTSVAGARAGPGFFGGEPYDVELELYRVDGDWRVIGAEWRPAGR